MVHGEGLVILSGGSRSLDQCARCAADEVSEDRRGELTSVENCADSNVVGGSELLQWDTSPCPRDDDCPSPWMVGDLFSCALNALAEVALPDEEHNVDAFVSEARPAADAGKNNFTMSQTKELRCGGGR
jgi:hypothetical protein